MEFILASGSPRRKALLHQIRIDDFTVCPADIEELVEPGLSPQETVMSLSRQKARAVAAQQKDPENAVILSADTVVCLDDKILGKPADPQGAYDMLRTLSGRTHRVCTGMTLLQGDKERTVCEETEVDFRALTDQEIVDYISTGEPADKAGAYGIQGQGSLFVTGIRGDYFNVMGLPLCALGQLLREFGVEPKQWKREKEDFFQKNGLAVFGVCAALVVVALLIALGRVLL